MQFWLFPFLGILGPLVLHFLINVQIEVVRGIHCALMYCNFTGILLQFDTLSHAATRELLKKITHPSILVNHT